MTTARASDYFGPRGATQSPFGDLVIGAALAGKPARVIGNPDLPHSYTYTADIARTLAALGTRDDVLGEVFHVPNAPALTTRQIIDLIAYELGSPIKVSIAPRFLLRVMGLFNKTVHEVARCSTSSPSRSWWTAPRRSHDSGSNRPRWLTPSGPPSPGSGTAKKQRDPGYGHEVLGSYRLSSCARWETEVASSVGAVK